MSLGRLSCPLKVVASDPQSSDCSEALSFPGTSTGIPRTLSNGLQKSELLRTEGLIIKELEKLPRYCAGSAAQAGLKCPEADPAPLTLGKSLDTLKPKLTQL